METETCPQGFRMTGPIVGKRGFAVLAGRSIQAERDGSTRFPYNHRPKVRGKFIYIGDEKFWVRGVTYGTFRPGETGIDYPDQGQVARDFAAIAANGMNTVRTYSMPPRWLLDMAREHGLRVMVGLAWEQHIAFLDDRKRAKAIATRVRDEIRGCAGHPAVLCYAVGNEIPAPIVRWHGRRRLHLL
jgi:beta-galactosidase/beta-glucuronidase